eukprot:scaffold71755_cov43-Cyclotella_meneghiniana.AAC.1
MQEENNHNPSAASARRPNKASTQGTGGCNGHEVIGAHEPLQPLLGSGHEEQNARTHQRSSGSGSVAGASSHSSTPFSDQSGVSRSDHLPTVGLTNGGGGVAVGPEQIALVYQLGTCGRVRNPRITFLQDIGTLEAQFLYCKMKAHQLAIAAVIACRGGDCVPANVIDNGGGGGGTNDAARMDTAASETSNNIQRGKTTTTGAFSGHICSKVGETIGVRRSEKRRRQNQARQDRYRNILINASQRKKMRQFVSGVKKFKKTLEITHDDNRGCRSDFDQNVTD